MELLLRLIEWLVRSALEQNKGGSASLAPSTSASAQAARARMQAGTQAASARVLSPQKAAPRHTHSTETRSQPVVTSSKVAAQDPAYDDGGWRVLLAVLALLALLVMVAVWLVYVLG